MRHPTVLAATFLCLFTLAAVAAPAASQQKGAMPFSVHNSTHVFQKNTYGGIQQVVAKDSNDKNLVDAIRAYVEAEAERFSRGDYGKGMPGVKYLSKVKPDQIAVTYRNVPAGAAVDYVGRDAASVDAIHKWLDAQPADDDPDCDGTSPR